MAFLIVRENQKGGGGARNGNGIEWKDKEMQQRLARIMCGRLLLLLFLP